MRSAVEQGERTAAVTCDAIGRTVRVAVLNQPVTVAGTPAGTRRAWLQAADLIRGIADGEPGLDLLVLSGHGPWHTGPDHLDLVEEACRRAGIWAALRLGGSCPRMALVDRYGHTVAQHGTARGGRSGPRIVDGPGGLRTALTFVGTPAGVVTDPGLRGAELVVALRVEPADDPAVLRTPVRALAWTQSCFVAAANACGTVGSRRWAGWSLVAGFDGGVLASCQDEECELAVADLDPVALRRARHDRFRSASALRATVRKHRAGPSGDDPASIL